MKKSTKTVLIILAVMMIISAAMICVTIIQTSKLGLPLGDMFSEMYIFGALGGLLLIGVGYLYKNRYPIVKKVLTIVGVYDIVVTAIVFFIAGV